MSRQKKNTFDAKSLLYSMIDSQTIQLVSVLGIGGNGVVYLGQNIFTGQLFAVKLLIHLRSAYKEVNIHAYLSGHPNILSFEKVIQENNKTYLIVEYAPGGDLFAAITQSGRGIVGNNDAIRHIFLQIIDAVEYCHQSGIAHCDLKPENILLSHNWQVKLADFGLASSTKISTEFGCGSEYYFSPECQGERIKHGQCSRGYDTMKSDVWSLGIILINLTAGRNPWKQANLQNASFAAYLRNPRHFFRSILPCISEELEYILLDIFCLDPALRISLSELRLHIFRCQSFVQQTIPATKYVPNCNSQKSYKTFDSDPTIYPTIKFVGDYTDDKLDYVKNTAAFIDISTDITSQPKDHLCDTKYPSNIIQNPYTNQQCYSTSNTSISSSCSSLDGYLVHYRDDMVYCS